MALLVAGQSQGDEFIRHKRLPINPLFRQSDLRNRTYCWPSQPPFDHPFTTQIGAATCWRRQRPRRAKFSPEILYTLLSVGLSLYPLPPPSPFLPLPVFLPTGAITLRNKQFSQEMKSKIREIKLNTQEFPFKVVFLYQHQNLTLEAWLARESKIRVSKFCLLP